MNKKDFVSYKEFLKYAKEYENELSNIKVYDGRLCEFTTKSTRCSFIYESGAKNPTKFVEELGLGDYYNLFVNKHFSKLKDFIKDETELFKWHDGYFGGLIGLNSAKINSLLGGQKMTIYDYDINSAYLYALTTFLPTKYVGTITPEEFNRLNEMEKQPFIYFFEIVLPEHKGKMFKVIGDIRGIYQDFDFLNSKQGKDIFVSEKRLSLINQIYFKNYEIKKVIVFKRGKFKFYRAILERYLQLKKTKGKDFKINALRLYGTLGQFFKKKYKKVIFDKKGNLSFQSELKMNLECHPQVAMWVADTVAEYLFVNIASHFSDIICWNTDGITSTKPLPFQISTAGGKWKLNKFSGIPYVFSEYSSRCFFKNLDTGGIVGSNTIIERNKRFYEQTDFSYNNVNAGFVKKTRLNEVDKNCVWERKNTLRNLILREKFVKLFQKEDF